MYCSLLDPGGHDNAERVSSNRWGGRERAEVDATHLLVRCSLAPSPHLPERYSPPAGGQGPAGRPVPQLQQQPSGADLQMLGLERQAKEVIDVAAALATMRKEHGEA